MIHTKLNKDSRIFAYVRKSRIDQETDDTLSKHRLQLREYIEKEGFTNVEWYEEIGSADSITRRPVFMEVLEKVEAGLCDAVLVVEYDRLSRGSQKDAGIITEIFKESDTLILTPNRTYDLNEESSEMLSEFESMIARQEYRQIKKRLKQGKINGTKEGRHTNGKPPFPYYYDRNTRSVKINEEHRKIYDYMLHLFIEEDLSTELIAQRFNLEGIPTISGKSGALWRQSQVARLLRHEFHLGYVFHGRYRRINGKTVKIKDPSKIIKVEGLHEPIKTQEQHDFIVKKLDETRLVPPRARKGEYKLSGLIRCGFCGTSIAWYTYRGYIHLRKCRNILLNEEGRCNRNRGISERVFLELLRKDMETFRDELFNKYEQIVARDESSNERIIGFQQKAIEAAKKRIERIKDLYIDGMIDKTELEKRKNAEEGKIHAAKKEIERITESTESKDEKAIQERKLRWEDIDLEELFEGDELSIKEKNEGFKKLIRKIIYKRSGDDVELDVIYK